MCVSDMADVTSTEKEKLHVLCVWCGRCGSSLERGELHVCVCYGRYSKQREGEATCFVFGVVDVCSKLREGRTTYVCLIWQM